MGKNKRYCISEKEDLARFIREVEPISAGDWDLVAEKHNAKLKEKYGTVSHVRASTSLRNQFGIILKEKNPTGESGVPKYLAIAREASKKINRKACQTVLGSYSHESSSDSECDSAKQQEPENNLATWKNTSDLARTKRNADTVLSEVELLERDTASVTGEASETTDGAPNLVTKESSDKSTDRLPIEGNVKAGQEGYQSRRPVYEMAAKNFVKKVAKRRKTNGNDTHSVETQRAHEKELVQMQINANQHIVEMQLKSQLEINERRMNLELTLNKVALLQQQELAKQTQELEKFKLELMTRFGGKSN